MTLLPLSAAAQSVTPQVAVFTERARGVMELANPGDAPATVVLEPFGLTVDTMGVVSYLPFDSSRVGLRLSAMAVRIPPRSTMQIGYEAEATAAPAWFVIASNFSAPRTATGQLRLQLPHVVYLNQGPPLQREAVTVHALEHDPVTRTVRFKVENTSARLGRCLAAAVSGPGGSVTGGAFPLFPGFWRWIVLEWPFDEPPTSVQLTFDGFTVERRFPDVD